MWLEILWHSGLKQEWPDFKHWHRWEIDCNYYNWQNGYKTNDKMINLWSNDWEIKSNWMVWVDEDQNDRMKNMVFKQTAWWTGLDKQNKLIGRTGEKWPDWHHYWGVDGVVETGQTLIRLTGWTGVTRDNDYTDIKSIRLYRQNYMDKTTWTKKTSHALGRLNRWTEMINVMNWCKTLIRLTLWIDRSDHVINWCKTLIRWTLLQEIEMTTLTNQTTQTKDTDKNNIRVHTKKIYGLKKLGGLGVKRKKHNGWSMWWNGVRHWSGERCYKRLYKQKLHRQRLHRQKRISDYTDKKIRNTWTGWTGIKRDRNDYMDNTMNWY